MVCQHKNGDFIRVSCSGRRLFRPLWAVLWPQVGSSAPKHYRWVYPVECYVVLLNENNRTMKAWSDWPLCKIFSFDSHHLHVWYPLSARTHLLLQLRNLMWWYIILCLLKPSFFHEIKHYSCNFASHSTLKSAFQSAPCLRLREPVKYCLADFVLK